MVQFEYVQVQEKTDRVLIEEMKGRDIQAFSRQKGVELIKRSRSYFWSADKELRACCTVSKRYSGDYLNLSKVGRKYSLESYRFQL